MIGQSTVSAIDDSPAQLPRRISECSDSSSPELYLDDQLVKGPPRKRRKVGFTADVVHEVPSSDTRHLWYSMEELSEMKRDAKLVCRASRTALENQLNDAYMSGELSGLDNNDVFVAQRGMERWSSRRHALARGLTVVAVKTEVFCDQARQSMGEQESLADVCQNTAQPAVRFALLLGAMDAEEARREYAEV